MRIPSWFQEKFFPPLEIRSTVLTEDGMFKGLAEMEPYKRGPRFDVCRDVHDVAKEIAVMQEPLVAKELGLPSLVDLIPNKYHVYRTFPPYWAYIWYKGKLKGSNEYPTNIWIEDVITAYIIEFPWEATNEGMFRRGNKNRLFIQGTPGHLTGGYAYETLAAIISMLHAFKLTNDGEFVGRVFIMKFLWYCSLMQFELLSYRNPELWPPNGRMRDTDIIREWFNHGIMEAGGTWGGLMLGSLYDSDKVVGANGGYKYRMAVNRLTMLITLFIASQQTPGVGKVILDALATLSTIVGNDWLLPIMEKLLKEVNEECQEKQSSAD